jgi:hypothetical protein
MGYCVLLYEYFLLNYYSSRVRRKGMGVLFLLSITLWQTSTQHPNGK